MNIDKFNWAQMFNNSKGKTSGSLFCGVIILLDAALTFFMAAFTMAIMLVFKLENDPNIIGFFNMLLMQSIAFAAIGTSLLGIHRLSKDKPVEAEEIKKEGE
jgi:hypothetical protein